ncbi:hypothetical protein LXL04_030666 [Taraxacum kok-saghyz]
MSERSSDRETKSEMAVENWRWADAGKWTRSKSGSEEDVVEEIENRPEKSNKAGGKEDGSGRTYEKSHPTDFLHDAHGVSVTQKLMAANDLNFERNLYAMRSMASF